MPTEGVWKDPTEEVSALSVPETSRDSEGLWDEPTEGISSAGLWGDPTTSEGLWDHPTSQVEDGHVFRFRYGDLSPDSALLKRHESS